MRVALLCLLVFLSGCGRWVGINAARREALSDALQELRFPLRPEEAALRMRGHLAITTRCDRLPTGETRCGGCTHGRCFQLLEENGYTRVTTTDELTEAELTSVWQPLDAESLTEVRANMDWRVQEKLIEQEQRFEPRWGLTGGLLASLSTDSSSLSVNPGGRVGVRRWFDAHFIGHAAVEYRFRAGEHELGLRAGVEVTRWTDGRLWGAVGAPGASVSMFIGPVLRFPTTVRGGVRTGVGFHLTDFRSAPLFAEVAAETTFAGEASRVTGTFTIGVGL